MATEKETFQESFHGARDTKVVIKSKVPLHNTSFGKQGCWGLGITASLLLQVIFPSLCPQGAVRSKKTGEADCNCFCYQKILLLKTKKYIKRDKNCLHRIFFPPPGQPCHLQYKGLSPWLSLALRKLLNSFPCFVFLNIRAATRIYALQQKEWTKKPMLLKEQNHVLKEKSKQRADLGPRKGPLPHPWNEYGSLQGSKSILLLTVESSLTSPCLRSILSFFIF